MRRSTSKNAQKQLKIEFQGLCHTRVWEKMCTCISAGGKHFRFVARSNFSILPPPNFTLQEMSSIKMDTFLPPRRLIRGEGAGTKSMLYYQVCKVWAYITHKIQKHTITKGLDKTPILWLNVKHLWKEKFLVSFLCSAFARAF